MIVANLPNNEAERLYSLDLYKVLDTVAEASFDEIVKMAAQVCHAKVAMIAFIDDKRVWPKATFGALAVEISRDISFCSHTILVNRPLVVPDLSKDPRFFENPLVTSEPLLRFYAAVPLVNSEGFALGTLCVMDTAPKQMTTEEVSMLQTLGHQVVMLLEYRRSIMKVTELSHELYLAQNTLVRRADPTILTNLDEDIRKPMAQIIGLAEQLNGEFLSDDQAESLQHIENIARRVQNLIVRADETKQGEFRLDHAMKDLKSFFQREADAKDLVLEAYAPQMRRAVLGDSVRIREVLMSLVGNALKFTNEGRVLLDVQVLDESAQSTVLRFNVRDSGCGIPLEKLTKIVSDLKETDTIPRRGDDASAGLVKAKRNVDRMGGTMGVESTVDVGSTFWFEIELQNTRSADRVAKSVAPSAAGQPDASAPEVEPLTLVAEPLRPVFQFAGR